MPGAAWHWAGDSSAANDTVGAPGTTLLYLCLLALRFSVVGATYFPIIGVTDMKKIYKMQGLYKRHLPSFVEQVGSQSGEPPQGAGISRKSTDVGHLKRI